MSTLDEFVAEFGQTPLSDDDLQKLVERARRAGDRDVRAAASQLQALKILAAQLLARVEASEPEADDPEIKLARFLIRGEGAIGSSRA